MNEQDRIRLDREASEMESKVLALVKSKFPMKLQGGILNESDLKIERPAGLNNLTAQHNLKMDDGSLYGALRGRFNLSNDKGKVIKQTNVQDIISTIPYKTVRGSYIAGGNERTISAQMRQAPGIYTERNGTEVITKIRFNATSELWTSPIMMHYDQSKSKFFLRFKIGNKTLDLSGITFLTDIAGASIGEVKKALGSEAVYIDVMQKHPTFNATLADVYALYFKDEKYDGTAEQVVKLRDRIMEQPNFGNSGEKRVGATVGVASNKLDKNVVLASITKLFAVARNDAEEDSIDDLRFKIVLNDQDFILGELSEGIDEFKNKVNFRSGADNELKFIVASPLDNLDKKIDRFIKADTRNAPQSTGIVEAPETTNPLNLISSTKKITQKGEGGISDEAARNADSARNLQPTAITRIDPVESPESQKIGLVRQLARNARATNGTIVSKFFPVKKGTANIDEENIVELDPFEEYDHHVAFYTPSEITKINNMIAFKKPLVTGRFNGKVMQIPREEIEYIDTSPSDIFGISAALVPFGDHNDGNRMLMATNQQKQSLLLKSSVRQAPYVQVAIDQDKKQTFEGQIGENSNVVRSPENGVVESVDGGHIVIKGESGKRHSLDYYDHFPMNQDNFAHNEVLVKRGDEVKAGQMVAEGWHTKDGKLALGLNARIAYLPYKGWNYEDGVVISREFADRVQTDEMESRDIIVYKDFIGGPGSGVRDKFIETTAQSAGMQKLDKDGIIMPGQEVGPGDILVAMLKPKAPDYDAMRSFSKMIMKGDETEFEDAAQKIGDGEYMQGKVLDVHVLPGGGDPDVRNIIRIRVKMSKTLKIGDKISGRHGNKGTITKILGTKEMPHTEDGRSIDVLFSPLVVPSRKNVGQLLEVNAGLIAEKTGKPYTVYNFDPKEVDNVKNGLIKIGVPDGKMAVIDPKTGKAYENKVTVGNMYILKLKHKVDEKLQSRSFEEGGFNQKYLSPEKSTGEAAGEKANPQRLGEMEMRVLQANQVPFNILETTTLKGDGAGFAKDRLDIFRAMINGSPEHLNKLRDKSGVPESLRILKDKMFVMGMDVKPLNRGKTVHSLNDTFSELMVLPTRDEDILRTIGKSKRVYSSETFQSTDRRHEKSDKAVPGGLYDPDIFGKDEDTKNGQVAREARSKWGYIELATYMPNPVLIEQAQYNPYASLLGMGKDKLLSLMSKDYVLITNPGDSGLGANTIVSSKLATDLMMNEDKHFEYKAGGEALMYLLSKINVNKELVATEAALKAAKLDKKDALFKKYSVLKMLQKNNMQPGDLMTKIVPVTPKYLRPRNAQGQQVIENGLTKVYSNLVDVNENSRLAFESGTPDIKAEQSNGLYRSMKYLYGGFKNDRYVDKKKKEELGGILDLIGNKEGLVRDKMLGKRVDYSGRAVIGVDPTLKIDEIGIPADIAKTTYKPFIIKELIHRGYVPMGADGERMAREKILRFDDDVKKVLDDIVKDRPILVNRAPSLHKFGIQAMRPVIRTTQDGQVVRNIQLNPMVVTGFGADFDGDQMGVHVPLSDKAVEEARNMMMPSDNLINPTNGKMILEIRHEMTLGIYYLTMNPEQTTGKNITYSTYKQLRADYESGKIKTRQAVTLNGKMTTAGQWLFFGIPGLQAKYRNKYFGQTMSDKSLKDMLREIYDDITFGRNETMGTIDLSNLMDNIKDLGFMASTRSGLSIGIKDLEFPEKYQDDIFERARKIDERLKGDEAGLIGAYQTLEGEVESELKAGAMGKDNPVTAMLQSGARGDAGQIRRMGGLVGVGRDIENHAVTPIRSSHMTGLSPGEYWLHSYDSLKGMADRALNTEAPGTLTRELWSAYQDKVISEPDCHTTKGILINKEGKIVGRYASKDITSADGSITYVKAGQPITQITQTAIGRDKTIKFIQIRSPATCATVNGLCQKCYGWETGRPQPPKLGYPAGVIASQAIGEPVTQMTMKTFHGGGTSSNVTLGLPRILEMLHPESSNLNNIAVLSKNTGRVEEIKDTVSGTDVVIGKKKYHIPFDENGNRKPLRVVVGDSVVQGQFLTVGNLDDLDAARKDKTMTSITSARPVEIMNFAPDKEEGLNQAQNYMIGGMQYAIDTSLNKQDAVDRRHIELTVGKLTENVKISDSGDSPYMDGQEVKRNVADRWNADNVTMSIAKLTPTASMDKLLGAIAGETVKDRSGQILVKQGQKITRDMLGPIMLATRNIKVTPRPIIYVAEMDSPQTAADKGHDNWFSNLGHQNIGKQLSRGVSFGQVDKLEDPRARMMAGKLSNIGQEGHNWWEKFKNGTSDFANTISNSLLGMFQK